LKQHKLKEIQAKARNFRPVKEDESESKLWKLMMLNKNRLETSQIKKPKDNSAEAMEYLRNIIKRDQKPTNPEKKIMTKLYDRLNHNKMLLPSHYYVQQALREKADKVKHKIKEKGVYLENEIELCSRSALQSIEQAFKEMDNEEQTNPNQKKLTSIQRNRMAINFLEMNDAPDRYLYYKRFIDE
jgi:hypothetical protein